MTFSRVPGRGDKNATLAFIGEAPGGEEFSIGRPFVGPSGQMLSTILSHNLIDENSVWIDNVCQEKPAGRNPTFEEVKNSLVDLRSRLRGLPRLNCIVAVGDIALQALSVFRYSGITKHRGSILPARLVGKKMVPIVHPAWIMKDGNREHRFLHVSISDIARAKAQSGFPEIRRPARNHRILYNFDEAVYAIRHLRGCSDWAFDVETSLPCLGFAPNAEESFTVPFASDKYPEIWPARQRAFLIEELKAVFTKEAKIRTQNGLFDKKVLADDYGVDPLAWEIDIDTMYLHQLLYSELPHSLEFLCSVYTEEPFYKDEGRLFRRGRDDEKQYFTYNGKDCCVTFETADCLIAEARESGQLDYYYQVIQPMIQILYRMHANGVLVSEKELESVKRELKRKICISRIKLIKSLGFEVNPRSPLDMEQCLSALRIPERDIKRSPKTGKVSTDEDYLQRIYAKFGRPELMELLSLRKSLYLQSGFTSLSCDPFGRFHAIFKFGPKSGRLASSGDDKGPQLQNITPWMRRIFVAPPGRKLVELDLEQADTRCLAYGAPEFMLMQLFESEDSDIHAQVCSEVFGIDRKLIDKHGKYKDQRHLSKIIGHGTNYGMGPRKLVSEAREKGVFIKESAAREFQNNYLARFYGIHPYHEDVKQKIRSSRVLYDLNGRRHVFMGYIDDTLFREAFSRMPQGTVAGYMKRAMIALQWEFDNGLWRRPPLMLIQVHDSLVSECDDRDVLTVAALMHKCFTIVLNAHGRTFSLPMEISAGQKWGELECLERASYENILDTPKTTNPPSSIISGAP